MSQFVRIDEQAHVDCILRTADSDGLEAVFCYDLRNGMPLGAALGTSNGVGLPDKARDAGRDRLRDIKVVHTHPNGENISLSPEDLRVLWNYPGVYEIDAVTAGGSWFRATRVPTDRDHETDARFAIEAIKRAVLGESALNLFPASATLLEQMFYDEVRTHIICAALDRLGVIQYTWKLAEDHRDLWELCEPTCMKWIDEVVREYKRQGW